MMRAVELCRSRGGFSIISVLVAIILMAVAVVAISTSSAFVASLQTDAAQRATAAAIATAYMESVKIEPPAELESEGPTRVDASGSPSADGAYVRSLQVRADPKLADAVRATVRVLYPAGLGRERTVELVTIIYAGAQE